MKKVSMIVGLAWLLLTQAGCAWFDFIPDYLNLSIGELQEKLGL